MRILLLFYCWSCLFGLLQGLSFKITRRDPKDVFSNPSCVASLCNTQHGSSLSGCSCQCSDGYPTFVMQNGCKSNRALRNLTGCKVLLMDEQGRVLDNIAVVDPTKKEDVKLEMPSPNLKSCKITGRSYLSLQQWQRTSFNPNANEEIRVNGNHLHLKWDKSLGSQFRGRIIKIDFTCDPGQVAACVVFKATGTESYIISKSTSAPTATRLQKTTEASDSSTVTTSKATTTEPQQTTEETTRKTTTLKSSTVVSTKVSIFTTSVPRTTTGTSGTEEPTEETTPSEPAVSTELTEPTNGPETPGGKDANKGERTGEDGKVAIIATSASVVCVAIISFCIWLIFTQRRKRQAGRCVVETEVIANPTSKNNLPLPSMLKNPVFAESDYLEPCDQPGSAHAKPLAVGSPVYDSANLHMGSLLLKNPLVKENRRTASAMPMKTLQKIPNNERSTSNENTYDNAERKSPCEEERPVYQALMVGRPKGGASKQAGDDAFYQALESAPPKRDQPESMYQALVIPSTGQSQEQQEIPEYLAVVTSPNESPDYADCSDVQGRVDAQPTRAELDNPVYDVLEEPDYAELEGPE